MIKNIGYKIPHVGWNTIENFKSPLLKGLNNSSFCYFVHSYYVPKCSNSIATCTYANIEFSAAMRINNFYGCQFHPEKSGDFGEQILKNFLKMGEDK